MIPAKRDLTRWSLALLVASSVGPAAAAQDEVCEGYETSQRILRFGSSPISSDGADTLQDLQRLMQEHRGEMERILVSKTS